MIDKNHKNMLQKRIDPNCIIINFTFHNFNSGFFQIKSDFNLKSFFLAPAFGHKGQSGVLAQTCSVQNCLKLWFDEEKLTFLVQHNEPIGLVKLA